MALVELFACDGGCGALAAPEDGSTKRKPLTPYGWLEAHVLCQGSGPAFMVRVCGISCLEKAVRPAFEDAQKQM